MDLNATSGLSSSEGETDDSNQTISPITANIDDLKASSVNGVKTNYTETPMMKVEMGMMVRFMVQR